MIGTLLHLGARAFDAAGAALDNGRWALDWLGEHVRPRTELMAARAAAWVLAHVPQGDPALAVQIERLGAECDALRGERDRARVELATLTSMLRGVAHRLTTEEIGLACAEMAQAATRDEATQRQLAELRAAARRLIEVRDRAVEASAEAEATGQPEALAPWIETQEALDKLGELVRASHG